MRWGNAIVVKTANHWKRCTLLFLLHQPIVKVDKLRTLFPEFLEEMTRRYWNSNYTNVWNDWPHPPVLSGVKEQPKENELSFEVIHVSGKDHASYYPEATDLLLKLTSIQRLVRFMVHKVLGQKVWINGSIF